MAILGIRIIGDPVLRTPAQEVTEFGPEIQKLVDDMEQTMENVDGAGLAAPQVGVSLRVFTYQIGKERGHIINPVLELSEDFQPDEIEGCLSIPGISAPVPRRRQVVASGVDKFGKPVRIAGEGMLARCVQHETDHLDGILFLDRLAPEEKKAAWRTLRAGNYEQTATATVAQRAGFLGSSFGAGMGN
ncbi:peptide deformylase [Arthrobacter sp. MYb211]|uniref:peptide deformylase n=1 Tax=Micrococcaceae TaxID=1268 RepID=UPI000CFC5AA4|nr:MULTISPECIES: peptide deformylase [unclassified Arthrobacter]PRA01395.1 peptide deformylase [Arthrobacter sp. MYb224]PRA06413.1 peptide deformylase [Arthrobacter sp. MYb229]PRA12656.1 peptide deformylase [Arthrobacter sp. MYb221]PRB53315.1 peptide deformylase [Arthrobacter sp. MYb216]PRC09824.1 peptide deformylase [Arthrobacter sp. MYb211]